LPGNATSLINATTTKIPLRLDGIRRGAVEGRALLAQPRHVGRQDIVEALVGGEERAASPSVPVKRPFRGRDRREPVRYLPQGFAPGRAPDERVDAISPGILSSGILAPRCLSTHESKAAAASRWCSR
jgi:hypothetical protein